MIKRVIFGILASGVLLLGALGGGDSSKNIQQTNSSQPSTSKVTTKAEPAPEAKSICDGSTITTNCAVDNIDYVTYVYHPAVSEKSHTETVITYKEQITGHCTLCNDGTYPPSCATGRGACSHHGGVAQWNAPRYSNVPEYTNKTIVDAPAQPAYYEKVPK